MRINRFTGKFSEIEELTGKVRKYSIRLVEPEIIEFKAGQFVNIKVGERARRSYSISSAPGRQEKIETIVDISPGGPGSQFFQKAEVGDDFEFMGPLGDFVLEKSKDGAVDRIPHIFLATGTGITPFLSMFSEMLARDRSSFPIYLYWGLRSPKDIYLDEYLGKLEEDHSNFKSHICLSKPGKHWDGREGYNINNLVHDWNSIKNIKLGHFYLCGSDSMITSAKNQLLEKHVDINSIFTEKFY